MTAQEKLDKIDEIFSGEADGADTVLKAEFIIADLIIFRREYKNIMKRVTNAISYLETGDIE